MLRTAGAQARAWQEAGISSMRICINISQRQLAQHDFPDDVHRILNETGCDPHIFELEITESCVMDRPDHVIAKLQALHEMGIKLSLDDFGTGYSSLGYLKRFPLDRLKIDRSFVAGLPEDSSDIAIVQTTIVLARHLGLSVVAEGVETEAQQRLLKAYGCHEMQGYLLGKPLPAEELEKIFE
ncbi:MAG: EAL domain-containing protein [Gammaproteobacteria bacterium]|nr:EAL domain-containing protein [Gammaproteobacteria bacterium]